MVDGLAAAEAPGLWEDTQVEAEDAKPADSQLQANAPSGRLIVEGPAAKSEHLICAGSEPSETIFVSRQIRRLGDLIIVNYLPANTRP
jgi:hypothetical protein